MKLTCILLTLLAIYVIGAFLFNALIFLLSYYESQTTQFTSGRWKAGWPKPNGKWFWTTIKEAPFTMFGLFVLPFGLINRDEEMNRRRGNELPPVLFVHGWSFNRICWWVTIKKLAHINNRKFYTVNLPTTKMTVEKQTDFLAKRIDEALAQTGHEKIVVVAHSLGGLVTRFYAAQHGTEKLDTVVTLGSPHYGTKLAYLGPQFVGGIVMREMEPGSETLTKLAKVTLSNIRVINIATVHDNFVMPFDTAFLPGAEHYVLQGKGHNRMLVDSQVIGIIADTLILPPQEKKAPKPAATKSNSSNATVPKKIPVATAVVEAKKAEPAKTKAKAAAKSKPAAKSETTKTKNTKPQKSDTKKAASKSKTPKKTGTKTGK